MKFLKKEFITKKTVGIELIESILSGLLGTLIIYYCLTFALEPLLNIFNAVNDGKISAFQVAIISGPMLIIIMVTVKLVFIVSKSNQNTEKTK